MSQQSWNAVPCVKCFKQLTMRMHTIFPSADMFFLTDGVSLHAALGYAALCQQLGLGANISDQSQTQAATTPCPILTCPIGTLIKTLLESIAFSP